MNNDNNPQEIEISLTDLDGINFSNRFTRTELEAILSLQAHPANRLSLPRHGGHASNAAGYLALYLDSERGYQYHFCDFDAFRRAMSAGRLS